MRWLHDRSIGQKFFISFGVILSLLALSLTALLVYLSRINSYVDRHKRITVPAIVTEATMQRSAYEMNLTLHLFLEQITNDSPCGGEVVMKNWQPLVPGPAFAIASRPVFSNLRPDWNSSSNL